MPVIPNIEHIEKSENLIDSVYVVSPNENVSRTALDFFARNNPKACQWIKKTDSLCMSFPAFMLFVYGPTVGIAKYKDQIVAVNSTPGVAADRMKKAEGISKFMNEVETRR